MFVNKMGNFVCMEIQTNWRERSLGSFMNHVRVSYITLCIILRTLNMSKEWKGMEEKIVKTPPLVHLHCLPKEASQSNQQCELFHHQPQKKLGRVELFVGEPVIPDCFHLVGYRVSKHGRTPAMRRKRSRCMQRFSIIIR